MGTLSNHIEESDEDSISDAVEIVGVEPEPSNISHHEAIQALNILVEWATHIGVNISDILVIKSIQDKNILKRVSVKLKSLNFLELNSLN